jgi:hypothetical protein
VKYILYTVKHESRGSIDVLSTFFRANFSARERNNLFKMKRFLCLMFITHKNTPFKVKISLVKEGYNHSVTEGYVT